MFSWFEEKVVVTDWLGAIFSGEAPASYSTQTFTSRFWSCGRSRTLETGVSCPISAPSYRDRTRLAFGGREGAGKQQEGKSLGRRGIRGGAWCWLLAEPLWEAGSGSMGASLHFYSRKKRREHITMPGFHFFQQELPKIPCSGALLLSQVGKQSWQRRTSGGSVFSRSHWSCWLRFSLVAKASDGLGDHQPGT